MFARFLESLVLSKVYYSVGKIVVVGVLHGLASSIPSSLMGRNTSRTFLSSLTIYMLSLELR